MGRIKVGDIRIANSGCEYKVVEKAGSGEFLVEFQDPQKFRKIFRSQAINRGCLWNPYHPTVFGIGYFGEGIHTSGVKGTSGKSKRNTKEYNAWLNMLQRCYYDKYVTRVQGFKAYDEVHVCEDWHNFQAFAEWYSPRLAKLQGLGERRYHLDKDLLSQGTSTIYSPDTCCVIPMIINTAMINQQIKDDKRTCVAKSESTGKYNLVLNLGGQYYRDSFDSEETAISMRIKLKKEYMESLAEKYKEFIEDRVYNALYAYNKF